MIKQNMKHLNRLFVILDGILVVVSLFFAWFIRIESGLMYVEPWHLSFSEYMKPIVFLVPTYLIAYNLFNLYRPHRTKSLYDEIVNLIKANTMGILVFLAYLYTFRVVDYSRKVLAIFFVLLIVLAFFERIVIRYMLRRIRKQSKNLKHIVLVGFSDLAIEYSRRINTNRHWGYSIKGIFDDTKKSNYVSLYKQSVKMLGSIDYLEEYLATNDLDEVVITISLDQYSKLEHIVDVCEKQGIYTRIIPDYFKVIPSKPYIEDIDGLPVISLRMIPLNDIVKKSAKRLVDIVVSLFGMIVLSPIFMILIILIKIESKGPIIYTQERVGLNRRTFNMYKFRSMRTQSLSREMKEWTTKNDPRVTKIGALIRKTSLDEFPQLINVLKGDMSLIGPRPERPQFVEEYKEVIPKYMVKHQVRPGITGWAQVHGLRGDTSIIERIQYDLYYIENWSVKMEIKIFLMTFIKGFINKNAY